jgi:hypothetical protein
MNVFCSNIYSYTTLINYWCIHWPLNRQPYFLPRQHLFLFNLCFPIILKVVSNHHGVKFCHRLIRCVLTNYLRYTITLIMADVGQIGVSGEQINIQLMTFDDVNTRIDQPMEHDIHRGIRAEYHVPWVDQSLYSPKLKFINCKQRLLRAKLLWAHLCWTKIGVVEVESMVVCWVVSEYINN